MRRLERPDLRLLLERDADNRRKYLETSDAVSAHERLEARNTTVGKVKDGIRRFGNLFNFKN